MKKGFSFIEVIIALALVSVILGVLFNTFFSIYRASSVVENVAQQDSSLFVVYHQMHKDFAGVSVPFLSLVQYLNQKKKDKKDKEKALEKGQQEKVEEAPVKPIKRIFSYNQQKNNMKELSFITTQPILVYEQAKNIQPKARFLRVTYSFIEHPEKKGVYALYRKEHMQLNVSEETKQEKGILVADNIKSLSCEFHYPIFKKDEKNKKEWVMVELKKTDRWQSDELLEDVSKTVLLPQFMTVSVTLWDIDQKEEQKYSFECTVQAYDVVVDILKGMAMIEEKEEVQKDTEGTKETKKSNLPLAQIKLGAKGKTINT